MALFAHSFARSSSPHHYLWCRACRRPAPEVLIARRPRSASRRSLPLALSAPRVVVGCQVRFVLPHRPAVLSFGVPAAGLLAVPRVYARSPLAGVPRG